MLFLFTILSVALSYPYAQYGPGPEPVLRNNYYPYMYGNQGIMGMINQVVPGLFTNPATSMFIDSGDYNDIFEAAATGNIYKVYDKVYDSMDYYPYFAPYASQLFGQAGAAGAKTGTGSTASPSSFYNPYYWDLINLQKPLVPVNPVLARARQTTGMTGTAATTAPTNSYAQAYQQQIQNFMGLVTSFFPGAKTPGQAYMMADMYDYGDMQEAMEKAMKGDIYSAYDKLFDNDYAAAMAMQAANRRKQGTTGTGAAASTGSSTTATMSPYLYGLIDLQKPKPQKLIQPVVYPNGAVRYFPVSQ